MKSRRPRPLQWVRYGVQTVIAAYVLVLVVANTSGGSWAANQHTVCPFGGVVNLYTYFSGGGYVAKLHSAVFIMLIALLAGLVLTGKSFCGWICPLGSVQQALGWVGQRLWPRAYNKAPRWLERILQYLKWAVLAWVLVQTARSATLVFQNWDPYYNLYRIWTDEVALSGYIVTGLTVVLSLFIPRPFSRFACPLGAFNGLFNSFSFIGIKRDPQTCTDCGRCSKVCPVNIDLCAGKTIRSIECTRCLKCVDVCPQNSRASDTLKLHTWFSGMSRLRRAEPVAPIESTVPAAAAATDRGQRRSVATWLFAGIAVAAFVLPILITNLTGDFQITGGKGGGGGQGQESTTEGSTDSQTIRGSSSLADVQALGADMSAFLQEFGIPADTSLATRIRDLTEQYGFEVEDVRAYLAAAQQ